MRKAGGKGDEKGSYAVQVVELQHTRKPSAISQALSLVVTMQRADEVLQSRPLQHYAHLCEPIIDHLELPRIQPATKTPGNSAA